MPEIKLVFDMIVTFESNSWPDEDSVSKKTRRYVGEHPVGSTSVRLAYLRVLCV